MVERRLTRLRRRTPAGLPRPGSPATTGLERRLSQERAARRGAVRVAVHAIDHQLGQRADAREDVDEAGRAWRIRQLDGRLAELRDGRLLARVIVRRRARLERRVGLLLIVGQDLSETAALPTGPTVPAYVPGHRSRQADRPDRDEPFGPPGERRPMRHELPVDSRRLRTVRIEFEKLLEHVR